MALDKHMNIRRFLTSYGELLEERKSWGPIASWRYTEFRQLSEELTDLTGVSVSYMTLIRIFQKQDFKRSPQLATLDALAKYLDFEDWETFCVQQDSPTIVERPAGKKQQDLNLAPAKSKQWIIGVLIFLGLILLFWFLSRVDRPVEEQAFVYLESVDEKVMVPEMFSFRYSVPGSGYFLWLKTMAFLPDSLFQPPLNTDGLKELDPQDSIFTWNADGLTFPGPYRASILKDGQVFSEADVYLETQEWIGVVRAKGREKSRQRFEPIIVNTIHNAQGQLDLTPSVLQDIQEHYIEKNYEVNYFFGRDFKVDANQMDFEAKVIVTFPVQLVNCKYVRVSLLTTNGMIEFPLVQKGCKTLLKTWVSEKTDSYKNRSMEQYQADNLSVEHIRVSTGDKRASIYWNDELIDEIPYNNLLGELRAIRFKFDGYGKLDDLRLSKTNGEVVYSSAFDDQKMGNQ
ncbi:MAG: hypothetical protein HRU41_42105 [Saprospiraceae bacterium]|nr:hypothetical protein [Saprospiraceae bacterium]